MTTPMIESHSRAPAAPPAPRVRVRRRWLVLAAGFAIAASATERVIAGSSSSTSTGPTPTNAYGYRWKPLATGASGWVSGIDLSADGRTRLVRTDVGGAYRWDTTTDRWASLLTAATMPAAVRYSAGHHGVFEVTSAPSDSARIYAAWRNSVFVSRDRGASFTAAGGGLPGDLVLDANTDSRTFAEKLTVSPVNADTALLGTPANGLWRTTDAGASWTKVTTVPDAGKGPTGLTPGVTGIVFDRTNPSVVYATPYLQGTYRSSDGGATFARVDGAPLGVVRALIAADGTYYGVEDTGAARAVRRASGGVWTTVATPGNWPVSVDVDPHDPAHLVVDDESSGTVVYQSNDRGATFTASRWTSVSGAGDVPHLADGTEPGGRFYSSAMVFDPTDPNRLWMPMGFGVLTAVVAPGTATFAWSAASRGIEELVAKDVVATAGGAVVTAAMDRAVWVHPNLDAYPDRQRPATRFNSAWDLDWSPADPNYVVANIGDMRGCCYGDGLTIQSGYSTDGGNTWTRFPSIPTNPPTAYSWGFGEIAVGRPGNVVWIPAGSGKSPYVTTDNGVTWNPVTFPGVDPANTMLHYGWYLDRKILAADRVDLGTFYVYHQGDGSGTNGGVLRSNDGGRTWSLVHAGILDTWAPWNAQLEAVPQRAGHLFFTDGPLEPVTSATGPFQHSTDGGATWHAIPNVTEVSKFGFGKPAVAGGYPTIFIAGYVGGVYGVYRSTDEAQGWTKIADFAADNLDEIATVTGDPNVFGRVYVGFGGSGFAYGDDAGSATPVPTATPAPTPKPTAPATTQQPATSAVSATTATATSAPPTTPSVPGSAPATTLASGQPFGSSGVPTVTPARAVARQSVSIAGGAPPGCVASNVYVAVFDVSNPYSWSVVTSAYVPISAGRWRADVSAPSTTGSYLVRSFCGDAPAGDASLTVVEPPPTTTTATVAPTTTTIAPASPTITVSPEAIPAGGTFAVSSTAATRCSGQVYVALFDTSSATSWRLVGSAFVASASGDWTTTVTAPVSTGVDYLVRTFCAGSIQAERPVAVVPAIGLDGPHPTVANRVSPAARFEVTSTAVTACSEPVYLALFDVHDATSWSLTTSAYVDTGAPSWRAALTAPTRSGADFLLRFFCGGRAVSDTPLVVRP